MSRRLEAANLNVGKGSGRTFVGGVQVPTLYVLQGPDKGRTYQTLDDPAIIGRSSDQIQLSDHSTSRHHAEIRPSNGTWVLVDLGSSNGTYLNGQRIVAPAKLKYGDQIKVGTTLLVFGGQDQVERYHGASMIQDLVDLDLSSRNVESSILSAVDASAESVIIQAPETADAVAAWNVVYKVAEIIGSGESLEAFFERVADIIFDHLIVDHLIVLRCETGVRKLTPVVVRYRGKERKKGRPKIVTSQTIINHVLKSRDGVLCANAMTDARFSSENLQDSIHRFGLRSIICVPIIGREQIHGVIHLDCSMSHHTYTQEQLRLAVAVGRLLGLAIDNAHLLETKMRTAQLAATGETVAYLSHHIRNILQGMQGGADTIELGLKKKNLDAAFSGWTLMRRNLDRIYHLAMNMLTFSRDRKPRVEMAQLNKIVEEVIDLAHARADEKSVMLLSELDDLPAVPLDPDGVHQVVHNIILNAIDATPSQGGQVIARSSYLPDKNCVEISIWDNGSGIPQNQINRIFDVFHSSKGHGGTGLGLAAAKKIVDESGGEIAVDSAANEGTTFRIRLPLSHPQLMDSDRTHGPANGGA